MSEVVAKSAKAELLEAVNALKILGKCGVAVLADKKVSVTDLPALIALAKEQDELVEGVKGLDNVKVKELSLDDLVEIGLAVVAAIKEVKA